MINLYQCKGCGRLSTKLNSFELNEDGFNFCDYECYNPWRELKEVKKNE